MTDMVNNPVHYNAHPSGLEVIELTELLGFRLGNATKYVLRHRHKGKPIEDLEKAAWYLRRIEDTSDSTWHVESRPMFKAAEIALRFWEAETDVFTKDALRHMLLVGDDPLEEAIEHIEAEVRRLKEES